MTAIFREKSSQIRQPADLRDEKTGAPGKCVAFCGVKYRRFVSCAAKETK